MRICVLFLAFLFSIAPAHAEEVSIGEPISVGRAGDDSYYRGKGKQRPYVPVQPVEPQPAPTPEPPKGKPGEMTPEEAAATFQHLDPIVQDAAIKKAAARAERLSWLVLPPGGAKWAAIGAYLGSNFGTAAGAAPYATGLGLDLQLYPTPWSAFAKARVGLLWSHGLDLPGRDGRGLDIEASVGWQAAGLVGIRVGYVGTRTAWTLLRQETTSLGTGKTTVESFDSWQHGAIFGLDVTLRGATIEGTCRVGGSDLRDVANNVLGGTAAMCGVGLRAALFVL